MLSSNFPYYIHRTSLPKNQRQFLKKSVKPKQLLVFPAPGGSDGSGGSGYTRWFRWFRWFRLLQVVQVLQAAFGLARRSAARTDGGFYTAK